MAKKKKKGFTFRKEKSKFLKKPVNIWGFLLSFITLFLVFTIISNSHKSVAECANSISCISDLRGEGESQATAGVFMGQTINTPPLSFAKNPELEDKAVLGESTSNKKILIDLTSQKLYAKEGDRTIYEFPISSGKWGRTPTGTFQIWIKLRYTRMVGGRKEIGTYYNLPNVPYTMYFYNEDIPKYRGYGIHGAYWHNNFGHPMSHGCINMKPEDSGVLYAWANPPSVQNTTYATDENPGTPIEIYGTAPNE